MSFWVAGAAVVGTIGGAVISNQGAKKAAGKAAEGSQAAIDEQRRQFDLIRSDTAPYRAIGNQALNALGSIYGYSPTYGQQATPAGNPLQYSGGGGPSYMNSARQLLGPKNAALGLISPSAQLFSSGKILGGLFGSQKGDEKRNLKAFLGENKVYDLGDGQLQLEDGTQFSKDQLEHMAGLWYGATYAPDGGQEDWQRRYNEFTGGLTRANIGQAGGGLTSDGVPQGMSVGTGNALTAPDYSAFYASPDYNFRRTEGMRGVEQSAAARGGASSGNALKALAEFNSNIAAGEFGNYFNRQAALAGIGQTATSQSANAGLATGANVGNALIHAGNARASGVADQYNAIGAGLSGLGQAFGYWNANRGGMSGYGGPQAMNWGYGRVPPGSYG